MLTWIKDQFIVYSTARLVQIRNPIIATLFLSFFLTVCFAILGSMSFDLRGLYQKKCPVRGVVLSKVKGHASTVELSDEELTVGNPEIYKRVWDATDIVFPPQVGEGFTGSFLLVTNLIITPNQTIGTCAEKHHLSKCAGDGDCQQGYRGPHSSGIYTGKCLADAGSCEVRGWCPVESTSMPRGHLPLLEDVQNFTILLKNIVVFPDCGDAVASNLMRVTEEDCQYNDQKDMDCPIFKLSDILRWAGEDFYKIGVNGGVIKIRIEWDCDFDFGYTGKDCKPKYKFFGIDTKEGTSGGGFNFRAATFHGDTQRTLRKQFAIKVLIDIEGEGKTFDFFVFFTTLGATVGIFSVGPAVCDFLVDVFDHLVKTKLCGRCVKKLHDNPVQHEATKDEEKVEGERTVRIDHRSSRFSTFLGHNRNATILPTVSVISPAPSEEYSHIDIPTITEVEVD